MDVSVPGLDMTRSHDAPKKKQNVTASKEKDHDKHDKHEKHKADDEPEVQKDKGETFCVHSNALGDPILKRAKPTPPHLPHVPAPRKDIKRTAGEQAAVPCVD